MNRIIEAAQFANKAHRGQFRKWGHAHVPYIVHPMRVAGMVSIEPGVTEDIVAAAWLHDVVEDTRFDIGDIHAEFGHEVARIVLGLTNPSKGSKAPRAERKRMDREHLAKASDAVKLIKLADRLDNLTEADDDKQTPENFKRLYIEESFLLWQEALQDVDSPMSGQLFALLMRMKEKL